MKHAILLLLLASLSFAQAQDSAKYEYLPDMYRSAAVEAYVDYSVDERKDVAIEEAVASRSVEANEPKVDKIKWMTWDQAIAQSKKDSIPKKMFVDFYTGWCGWCKKMDASTFIEPNVVSYMNANFYPVKFDAETMDTIVFNGTTFMNSDPTFKKSAPNARGKVHYMAYSLLDGKLSYPSYAILDENFTRVAIFQGAKQADAMLGILVFFKTDQYKHYHNYLSGQWNKQLELSKKQQAEKSKAEGK